MTHISRRTVLACLLAAFASVGASHAQDAQLLRVMTFNARNSSSRDGANHWSHRKPLFFETVKAYDPDLLGSQEVLDDQNEDLIAAFPEYTVLGVGRTDGKKSGERSPILVRTSRFEILDKGDFWLSETPEVPGSLSWDAAVTRICSWARLKDRTNGRELIFANTHFDHRGAVARERSGEILRERLPKLSNGAPVILTGDFNCTEDDPAWRSLATGGHALIDSYRAVHLKRSPDEATYHDFKGGTKGSRIDWIMVSAHFVPKAASIVRREPGKPQASDHFPVTATLEWKR